MRISRSGFTIVELLIVIVIIAILAAITIVAYSGIQRRANDSAATASARQAASRISGYHATEGHYPPSLSDAGLSSDGLQYVVNNASTPATFCVTATVGTSSFFANNSQTSPSVGGCPGHGVGGVAAITNVALNPGAETSLGWHSNNGAVYPRTVDLSIKRSGSSSIESHNLSSSTIMMSLYGVGALNGAGFPIAPNTTYHVSFYFRSGVPHQGRIICSFRLSDSSYSTLQYGSFQQGTVDQWTRASHTCTSPAGADLLRLSVHVFSLTTQPAGIPAYADDLLVVEGTTQHAYADGSSPNWIWNGTAHSSTSTGPAL